MTISYDKSRHHLTALDRKAIAMMVNAGSSEAKTPRIRYSLGASDEAGYRQLVIDRVERDDCGRPFNRRYVVQILAA